MTIELRERAPANIPRSARCSSVRSRISSACSSLADVSSGEQHGLLPSERAFPTAWSSLSTNHSEHAQEAIGVEVDQLPARRATTGAKSSIERSKTTT